MSKQDTEENEEKRKPFKGFSLPPLWWPLLLSLFLLLSLYWSLLLPLLYHAVAASAVEKLNKEHSSFLSPRLPGVRDSKNTFSYSFFFPSLLHSFLPESI